jgi:hypothetical protein
MPIEVLGNGKSSMWIGKLRWSLELYGCRNVARTLRNINRIICDHSYFLFGYQEGRYSGYNKYRAAGDISKAKSIK